MEPNVHRAPTVNYTHEQHRGFGHRHGLHRHHRPGFGHHAAPGVLLGGIMVAVGTLFMLRELHVIDDFAVNDLWPLFLVGFGMAQLQRRRGFWGHTLGGLISLLGLGILLENLHIVALGAAHFWPVLVVVAGLAIMQRGFRRQRFHKQMMANQGVVTSNSTDPNVLDRTVTMAGAQIKVDSQQFTGGSLSCMMGGLEIDLRQAALANNEAVLQVSAVLSGIELRIPEGWQLVNEIAPMMGGVEDTTHPPAHSTTPAPRLILRGSIVMGGVTVKN